MRITCNYYFIKDNVKNYISSYFVIIQLIKMAVQLKSSRSKFKITATAGAVIVGSYIVLKTFPHLTDSIYNYLTGSGEVEEDNEPIELEEEAEDQQSRVQATVGESSDESQVEISKWSDNRLKSWLKDVSTLFKY